MPVWPFRAYQAKQILVANVRPFLAHMLSLAEEKVSEWYTIFTLAFQVILGFAVP